MRLAINLVLSIGMLVLCTWLVWPDAKAREDLHTVVTALHWGDFAPYLAAYVGLLIVMHVCRSLRWNRLLAPLGVRVPDGPLLAISSVGFMAILALPARLGEFVRPGLLRKGGYTTASAALGTVAVERIVDGLMISLMVFVTFFMHRSADSPHWMMATAFITLGGFSGLLLFLVFAMLWPQRTVRFSLRMTLLPRFAPGFAAKIEHRILDMIRGFGVLKDARNMTVFVLWSVVYWGCNGLGVWVLARAFHLDLSIAGAFATMGLVGVGISLPNSPGLVGQFQAFTLLGLSLYLDLGTEAARTPLYATALAYAIAQHLLQVAWYVAMGGLGLATPWVSFHDLLSARRAPAADDASAQAAPPARKKLAPAPCSTDDPVHATERP